MVNEALTTPIVALNPATISHRVTGMIPAARIERAQFHPARSASKGIVSATPLPYGCATRQLWPVPRSTFKGTDNPNFFPVASISVFTSCFASSNPFSGTSKINSS